MAEPSCLLFDEPLAGVARITLNRPDKRNAMNNTLRGELLEALERNDNNPAVKLTVLRGAGTSFCAGYDLAADNSSGQPYHTAGGLGQWPRHVVDGWFRIWDLAKPVVAQVHGYCLAGGAELATACDLVYVAEDAKIGYPPVRLMSPPDMQFHPWLMGMRPAMEAMLTGDSLDGREAVAHGLANRAWPADALEAQVLLVAERIAKLPSELAAINKRSVHRAMEIMGMRAAIRAGTELQALAFQTEVSKAYMSRFGRPDTVVSELLSERDREFGDYREAGPSKPLG